jgi:hypothetical protein
MDTLSGRCVRFPVWIISSLLAMVINLHGVDKPVSRTLTLSAEEISRLRAKVAPLVAGNDDVALRKNSADVFRLVDALVALERLDDAERYLARVLKANAWAFEYQLTYGELLAQKGDTEALRTRATQVLQYAETDSTLRRAQALLGKPPIKDLPPLNTAAARAPELILVKIDGVSEHWLTDLRDALAKNLGITVTIAQHISVPAMAF